MSNRSRPYYPLDARTMAKTCRELARDLRAEHAMGWDLIELANQFGGGQVRVFIGRLDAADSLDEQAERWLEELKTGVPNTVDRSRIGM